ncbi:RJL family GTPase [Phlyctochytrium arcticum]|nr:RJL family GTPase [Phlyctochytrium arcticum]
MDRSPGHLSTPIKTHSDALRIKILTAGDAGTGKSCLIKRYCEGRFVSDYVATIGVDYGVKTGWVPVEEGEGGGDKKKDGDEEDKREVKFNFWDLSGHPSHLPIRNEFYRDTHLLLLVFSLSDPASFTHLTAWMEEVDSYGGEEAVTRVLIGNKVDLSRRVSKKEGERWGKERGMLYFETSCVTGEGVQDMFATAFRECVNIVLAKQANEDDDNDEDGDDDEEES